MTEADRELLELAADAAKLHWEWNGVNQRIEVVRSSGHYRHWSPLDDDGDAFRLMVKLEIDLCVSIGGHACAGCPPVVNYIEVPLGSDPAASTRRAIVLAAAAIQEAREAV